MQIQPKCVLSPDLALQVRGLCVISQTPDADVPSGSGSTVMLDDFHLGFIESLLTYFSGLG